jgi:hypothetical protein
MTSTRSSILVSAVILFASVTASAQSGTAIAEGLFRDGKKLLDDKKFAEACPKFEESARLEPSSGVELALGICYEGLGKTASAWAAYESAISLARRDNRKDREKAATAKAAALEPKLAHVTFHPAEGVANLPGLQLKEDNVVIGAAGWTNAPVDPGTHTLEVTANGKKPWQTSFTIDGASSSTRTVEIPALEDVPVDTALLVDQPGGTRVIIHEQPPPTNGFRIVAIASLTLAGATLVGASVLGGVAISNASDAKKKCPASPCSDAGAVNENDTAGTLADWSTALFVATGVLAVVGITFMFLHPPKNKTTEAHLVVGPGFVGLGGAF